MTAGRPFGVRNSAHLARSWQRSHNTTRPRRLASCWVLGGGLGLALSATLACHERALPSRRAASASRSSHVTSCLEVLAQHPSSPPETPHPQPTPHAAPELKLARGFIVDSNERNVQLSGLTWYQGELLTVSDKHDDQIWALRCQYDRALLVPWRRFEPPPSDRLLTGVIGLDLEGIAADAQGTLWLASEAEGRVLRLDRRGRAAWFGPPLAKLVAGLDLLQRPNAGVEGIVALGSGRMLLAAERQGRGLVEVSATSARGLRLAPSIAPPHGRSADLTGLAVDGNRVLGLYRAAHAIVELMDLETEAPWERLVATFATSERASSWAYRDQRYGLAEGLALSADHIWIVLDNNGDGRVAHEQDRRPTLFAFERPPHLRGADAE